MERTFQDYIYRHNRRSRSKCGYRGYPEGESIIPNKKKLQITVSSTTTKEESGVTKFAIKTDEDAYLIYAIKKGTTYDDEIAVGGEVMSADSGKYAADTPLKFFLTKDTGTNVSEKAGSYSGVAVFTAQLVAAT